MSLSASLKKQERKTQEFLDGLFPDSPLDAHDQSEALLLILRNQKALLAAANTTQDT